MLNRVEAVVRTFDPPETASTHAMGRMPWRLKLRAPDGSLIRECGEAEAGERCGASGAKNVLGANAGSSFPAQRCCWLAAILAQDDGVGLRIAEAAEQLSPPHVCGSCGPGNSRRDGCGAGGDGAGDFCGCLRGR